MHVCYHIYLRCIKVGFFRNTQSQRWVFSTFKCHKAYSLTGQCGYVSLFDRSCRRFMCPNEPQAMTRFSRFRHKTIIWMRITLDPWTRKRSYETNCRNGAPSEHQDGKCRCSSDQVYIRPKSPGLHSRSAVIRENTADPIYVMKKCLPALGCLSSMSKHKAKVPIIRRVA